MVKSKMIPPSPCLRTIRLCTSGMKCVCVCGEEEVGYGARIRRDALAVLMPLPRRLLDGRSILRHDSAQRVSVHLFSDCCMRRRLDTCARRTLFLAITTTNRAGKLAPGRSTFAPSLLHVSQAREYARSKAFHGRLDTGTAAEKTHCQQRRQEQCDKECYTMPGIAMGNRRDGCNHPVAHGHVRHHPAHHRNHGDDNGRDLLPL
jgi:hypothetical protein